MGPRYVSTKEKWVPSSRIIPWKENHCERYEPWPQSGISTSCILLDRKMCWCLWRWRVLQLLQPSLRDQHHPVCHQPHTSWTRSKEIREHADWCLCFSICYTNKEALLWIGLVLFSFWCKECLMRLSHVSKLRRIRVLSFQPLTPLDNPSK